jgi:hypothetical protein
MRNEVGVLINSIKDKSNPSMIADDISHFVIDSFREDRISLYEAYMVNMEAIKFKRLGYIQPAWNERVRITTCLTLLNQKLLSHVFNETMGAERIQGWALEAYRLNREGRLHFIMDRYAAFLEANTDTQLLEELLHVRRNYGKLSDDDGPYHNEVFPYHFYSPEEILLSIGEKDKYCLSKILDESIENLIVELNSF